MSLNSIMTKQRLLERIEDQLQMYAFACRLLEDSENRKVSRISFGAWKEKQQAISYAQTRMDLEHGILMTLIKEYGQKMYCHYCGKQAIYR